MSKNNNSPGGGIDVSGDVINLVLQNSRDVLKGGGEGNCNTIIVVIQ